MGSSYLSSPDEVSPYYPERFIRPLPKRTIRSRLSAEAADLISYPPNPPSAGLPAYSHYGETDAFALDEAHSRLTKNEDYEPEHDSYHEEDEHDDSCPHHGHHHHHHHCPHHEDEEDDLDSIDNDSPIAQRHGTAHRSSQRSPRPQRHTRYASYSGKSASTPDGYEAFENTNNKKKRKIPTSGSLSIHQSSLNSDFAHMGLSPRDSNEDVDISHGIPTSPSGLGVQGAGRGRSGRKSNFRNPLGLSTNGTNIRPGTARYDQSVAATTNGEKSNQGIISKAIASATTLLRDPLSRGQENVGVLDQEAKTTPTNSQFTFTCESDSKGVKFPEQSLLSPEYATRVNSAPAVAPSQTHKYANQGGHYAGTGSQQVPLPQQTAGHSASNQNSQKPRPRRRKGDVYALAARQRKLQQEYSNLQHPPAHDDIWICEFCEYESIFGAPPHALVRQYEIKDRKERKRLAEKRRLLEKAKQKGRKGKKQSKNAKSGNNASQQPLNHQNYDQQPLDQMDDYLDDGYDDDPLPTPGPPPPQATTKQALPGPYAGPGGGGGPASKTSSGSAGIAGGGTPGGTIR